MDLTGPPRLLLAWPAAAAYADGEAALEVAAELAGRRATPAAGRGADGPGPAGVGPAGRAGGRRAVRDRAGADRRGRGDACGGDGAGAGCTRCWAELRAGRIDADALAGARNRLRTRRLAELETPAGRAQRLARYQVLAGDADYLRRDLERLAAVDAQSLQLVVAGRLRDDQRVVVTGGIKSAPPGAAARPVPRRPPPAPRPRRTPAPFRLTKDDAALADAAGHRPGRTRHRSARGPAAPTRLRNGLTVWWLAAPGRGHRPPGSGDPRGQRRRSAGRAGRGPPAAARRWPDRRRAPPAPWTRWRSWGPASRPRSTATARACRCWSAGRRSSARCPCGSACWRRRGSTRGPRRRWRRRRRAPRSPERELARLMLGDQHPYVRALEPGGAGVNAAALRAFFDRHYQPGNATLVGTGPIAPAALARALERWSGGSARGAQARAARAAGEARPAGPARAGSRQGRGRRPAALASCCSIARAHAPPRCASATRRSPADSKDHAAVLVANELLGGRFGRLDRLLRLERPLALGLRTVADARRAGGVWVIEASFPAGDTWVGLQEILRTLDALASGEASMQEVGRARVVLTRRLARPGRGQAGPGGRAGRPGRRWAWTRGHWPAPAPGAGGRRRRGRPRASAAPTCRPSALTMVVSGDKHPWKSRCATSARSRSVPSRPAAPGPATTAALR